jgi:hypothetical protein
VKLIGLLDGLKKSAISINNTERSRNHYDTAHRPRPYCTDEAAAGLVQNPTQVTQKLCQVSLGHLGRCADISKVLVASLLTSDVIYLQ